MRTINSRNNSRGHSYRRGENRDYDEFSSSGMEDGWRNEDYYFDERQRDGFWNRDYSGNNYWAARRDVRDERFGEQNDYVPAVDYGRSARHPRPDHAYGYGNEGSAQMQDFENWRDSGNPEGYAGRNANDYRQGYADDYSQHRYDNGRYNGYGPSPTRERYRESRPYEDRSFYHHDYESYPAYEAPGYSDEEHRSWETDHFRNGGRPREFGRPHRPHIREKRY